MRIPSLEAKQQAIGIAVSFLKSQTSKPGWEWNVVDASPDLSADETRDRKTVVCWAVAIACTKDGCGLEGPAVLHVNIGTRQVSWFG
jgi:hypothetical protein